MNNVGNMVVSADGKRILLSAFNHGVQVLGGTGKQKGSFVVDGIPDLVVTSPNRRRLAVRDLFGVARSAEDIDSLWGTEDLREDLRRSVAGRLLQPLGQRHDRRVAGDDASV